jgi:hypothetical protein
MKEVMGVWITIVFYPGKEIDVSKMRIRFFWVNGGRCISQAFAKRYASQAKIQGAIPFAWI